MPAEHDLVDPTSDRIEDQSDVSASTPIVGTTRYERRVLFRIGNDTVLSMLELPNASFPPDLERVEIPIGEQDNRDREVILPGRFEAPQFMVEKGTECGYHCHLSRTIGKKDMGVLLTLFRQKVFAETHRKGKVRRPLSLEGICDRERSDIAQMVRDQLGTVPEGALRNPSKGATLLHDFAVDPKTPGDAKRR
jgi:hypothetical protein